MKKGNYCTWIADKNSQSTKLKIFNRGHLLNLVDYCFAQTTKTWEINGIHINNWDISNVTDLEAIFYKNNYSQYFNENISSWNVSNVTRMDSMFKNCINFNQNISSWNVSNVTKMDSMFMSCTNFNQNISSWNVSNVNNMQYMFTNCTNFIQDLSNWNIPKITNKNQLFHMFKNVQLPTCKVFKNFNAGWGLCSTYKQNTGKNKDYCNTDYNSLGIYSKNACSECFNRNNQCSPSEITELDYSQFIKS